MTSENQPGKRPWTRRTHKPLEQTPSDVFKPELIGEIKSKGKEPMSPIAALKAFGLEVDETQEDVLNSALLQVDNQIFSHTDEGLTFASDKIEAFIRVAQGARFQIFEIAKIPLEVKEQTLRNAPAIIHDLLEEQKKNEAAKLKQREKDWEGRA